MQGIWRIKAPKISRNLSSRSPLGPFNKNWKFSTFGGCVGLCTCTDWGEISHVQADQHAARPCQKFNVNRCKRVAPSGCSWYLPKTTENWP